MIFRSRPRAGGPVGILVGPAPVLVAALLVGLPWVAWAAEALPPAPDESTSAGGDFQVEIKKKGLGKEVSIKKGDREWFMMIEVTADNTVVVRQEKDHETFLVDESGERVAVLAWRYATEGHFMSGGTGVRGHVGSYHRMLSTYVNDLIAAGFRLDRIEEPVWDVRGLFSQVPIVVILAATPEAR